MAERDMRKDVKLKLVQLRGQGRERYLELAGIDVKKVLQVEQELEAQYQELAAGVQGMLKGAGQEIAEQQKASLEAAQHLWKKTQVQMTALPYIRWPWPWWDPCCLRATYNSHGDPVSEARRVVTYEAAGNIAHPRVEARSADANAGEVPKTVEAWFRFILDDPPCNGSYCVCPIVQMNGHWLAWAWASGCGAASAQGKAKAKVTLEVKVYQALALKGELWVPGENTPGKKILNESVEVPDTDNQSGFYYDSDVHGGGSLNVYLEAGLDATVDVRCIAEVDVTSPGLAWVDMATSPQFYFKVPEVHWGLHYGVVRFERSQEPLFPLLEQL